MSASALSWKKLSQLGFESLESRLVPWNISGSVYVDGNDSGWRDDPPGDFGIAGSTVELHLCPDHIDGHTSTSNDCTIGALVATTTTDANGNYTFTNVAEGDYVLVQPTQPAGYQDGKDFNGHNWTIIPAGTDHICLGYVACDIAHGNFGERPGPVSPPPPPPVTPPGETTGSQGLTPGFWKNNAVNWNGSAWAKTGYFMYQTVSSVFGDAFGAKLGKLTLVQALGEGGNTSNEALLRHSVAAVLNASHPDIDYPMTTTQIINDVKAALASGRKAVDALAQKLDTYNNYGATLDQHGNIV